MILLFLIDLQSQRFETHTRLILLSVFPYGWFLGLKALSFVESLLEGRQFILSWAFLNNWWKAFLSSGLMRGVGMDDNSWHLGLLFRVLIIGTVLPSISTTNSSSEYFITSVLVLNINLSSMIVLRAFC